MGNSTPPGLCAGTMRQILCELLLIGVFVVVTASVAVAGPWGALPDAIARLQANPREQSAQVVVEQAEASILR